MSDQNDKRAGFEEAANALTERAAGHYANRDYELQDEVLQCASMLHDMKPASATPAPQAAPSDLHAAIMNLPCHGFDHAYKEGHRDARHAAAELVAAAPAVAITQAATSEPEHMNTQSSREYLVQFMERHFTDKTYHRYIRGDATRNHLAGDFAWQMARALRMLAAPVAHLAGTTPNTEAPSEDAEGKHTLSTLLHWVSQLQPGKPVGTLLHAHIAAAHIAVCDAFNIPQEAD